MTEQEADEAVKDTLTSPFPAQKTHCNECGCPFLYAGIAPRLCLDCERGTKLKKNKDGYKVPSFETQTRSPSIGITNFLQPTTQSRRRVQEAAQFSSLPAPMKAKEGTQSDLDRNDMFGETKWDGTRTYIVKRGDNVRIFTAGRNVEHTHKYPKIVADGKKLHCKSCTLDGEFVFFDKRGDDIFTNIASLPQNITSLKYKFMAFDILEVDGRDTKGLPIEERKAILDSVVPDKLLLIKETEIVKINKRRFFERSLEQNREGVMLKQQGSSYYAGARSPSWLKIKRTATIDVIAKGATAGEGARQPYFGAIHCFYPVNGRLVHIGDVGTGFNNQDLIRITPLLRTGREFVIEVKYQAMTEYHKMRFPSFVRLRLDKTPQEVMSNG